MGAKLTHVITVLIPPTTLLNKDAYSDSKFGKRDTVNTQTSYMEGWRKEGHLLIRIKILRFFLLQNFLTQNIKGNAWHFQAWNIGKYRHPRMRKMFLNSDLILWKYKPWHHSTLLCLINGILWRPSFTQTSNPLQTWGALPYGIQLFWLPTFQVMPLFWWVFENPKLYPRRFPPPTRWRVEGYTQFWHSVMLYPHST